MLTDHEVAALKHICSIFSFLFFDCHGRPDKKKSAHMFLKSFHLYFHEAADDVTYLSTGMNIFIG